MRVVGIEPTLLAERDFESRASTSFTTPAQGDAIGPKPPEGKRCLSEGKGRSRRPPQQTRPPRDKGPALDQGVQRCVVRISQHSAQRVEHCSISAVLSTHPGNAQAPALVVPAPRMETGSRVKAAAAERSAGALRRLTASVNLRQARLRVVPPAINELWESRRSMPYLLEERVRAFAPTRDATAASVYLMLDSAFR